jgi:hypothetical protein
MEDSLLNEFVSVLKYNPMPPLLSSRDSAVCYFAKRDLLGERLTSVNPESFPETRQILKGQESYGSWNCNPSRIKSQASNYRLIETWKALRLLVDKYGLNKEHSSIHNAAEYIFTCQSADGDFRGFIANQYATYYTGALMSLLIKAGYSDDARIENGFQWLLSMRQDDGGWTIPILTHGFSQKRINELTSKNIEPVQPDRSKPFSHNWTGMVLRAFAAHVKYRRSEAARTAANLLKSRFFQKDCYTSYQSADYWIKFQFPFWWNNLVASLDSVSLIDNRIDNKVNESIDWLVNNQDRDGMWKTSYARGKVSGSKSDKARYWITLAICRVLKRLFP